MRAQIKGMMIQAAMKKSVLFVSGLMITSVFASACGDLTGPTSPETPTNVTATLGAGNKVTVSWTPSPQSDGVVSYNVMRNGTKVGESPTNSYVDSGLSDQTTYKYSVSANCNSGVLSDASAETPSSTVTTLDVTPPRVIANIPVNGSTVVSTFGRPTVTFSEPMNPSTINPSTFNMKVTSNGAVIPGTVTYNATTRVAEFFPTNQLPSLTNITVTVTTGAKDVAGNGLATPFTFQFTTIDQSPPFVLSTTPANGATGVSTTDAITVTFSEAMAASTINSTNFSLRVTSNGAAVGGSVTYDANLHIARFVPVAPLSELVNYTATVSGAVTDLAGNPMGASVQFSFTTGDFTTPFFTAIFPADQAPNVPTNVVVSATWSEPMDPASFTTTTFSLKVTSTGAAVAGAVVYNPATLTSTFTPTSLLAQGTNYSATLTSGVKDLAGNGLRVPFTWTFTTAVDNVPPSVISVVPAAGATNVPPTTSVALTFSEPMDAGTINGNTITLKNTTTGTPVAGAVSYNVATRVATFAPTVALANGTGYTVTVTTGAKDASGNPLPGQFTSTFTTAAAPDNTPPTVVATAPLDGATNVAISTTVTATFSEAMDAATITASGTFTLKTTSGGVAVPGTVTYSAATNTATFSPTSPLSNSTGYTATISTAAKDLAGNPLAANKVISFTTIADTTPPTVTSTLPPNNATGVPITTTVKVTFSEAMDAASVTASGTFTLKVSATSVAVPGAVTYDAATHIATFTPTGSLAPSTGYTATVTTAAKDLAGNPLSPGNVSFSFTTAP